MRRDIALWGIRSYEEVERILLRYTVTEGAGRTCSILKDRGYQLAIVSAGIDILASAVARELQIELCVANGLAVDAEGVLTGEGIFRVDLLRKTEALETIIEPLGLALSEVVAVGDSKYDVPFMEACGGSVAYVGGVGAQWDEIAWPNTCVKVTRLEDLPTILEASAL